MVVMPDINLALLVAEDALFTIILFAVFGTIVAMVGTLLILLSTD